jgi:hypothetical protein
MSTINGVFNFFAVAPFFLHDMFTLCIDCGECDLMKWVGRIARGRERGRGKGRGTGCVGGGGEWDLMEWMCRRGRRIGRE